MSASAQERARLSGIVGRHCFAGRHYGRSRIPSLLNKLISRDMTSLPPGPHLAVQHQMLMLDAITLGHESANNQKGVNEKGEIRQHPGLDKPQTVPGTLQKAHC
jgi:hypothetical protein